ncbi:MAG: hypothetical protein A3E88_01350 [Legionellales bacterium RIFCSPHIGHO2_12_FULL_35_11]|nr:MAG: hypothetical protein A3E88_01350 [Legionellales bacterium RIFCSPHIGHO2_12_FULL_35_11]
MSSHISPSKAVDYAISKYRAKKEPRIIAKFVKVNVPYPPKKLALLVFKKEKTILLWGKDQNNKWRYVSTYPLMASSGSLGPKLKEHDKQIPEGIYKLTMFNPYSNYHLSMMLNYPNAFDKLHAHYDGRKKLGGEIFLHGKTFSVGCLAVGDDAIEELFLISRRAGLDHIRVVIAPNDLRIAKPATNLYYQPKWLPELYNQLAKVLKQFPVTT